MLAPAAMLKVAAHADAGQVAEAAAYFAALKYKQWVKVVEADMVPRPEIHGVSAYAAADDGSREPIGERIVEVPEDSARTDLRDDTSGFVAYVPPAPSNAAAISRLGPWAGVCLAGCVMAPTYGAPWDRRSRVARRAICSGSSSTFRQGHVRASRSK
jgi:hypothetical protein